MRSATVIIDENFPGKPGAGPAFGHMTAQLLHVSVARNDKHQADLDQLSSPFQPIWGRRPLPQHRCGRGPDDASAGGNDHALGRRGLLTADRPADGFSSEQSLTIRSEKHDFSERALMHAVGQ
jgi:hypothetical protein